MNDGLKLGRTRKKSRFANVDKSLYLMLIPGAVILLIYNYAPLFGLQIAFKDFSIGRGILASKWVGLENFKFILNYPNFDRVVTNTVMISLLKLSFRFATPIIIALLLNEITNIRFKRVTQTFVYLPHFISWVVVAGILTAILDPSDGILNTIVKAMGGKPIYFLGSAKYFRSVLVLSDIWKEFGYGTIIYMAALTGIDPSLYEAATIDRANRWQKIRYITLPGIVPIMVLISTLSIGGLMSAGFDQIFNLYNPLVYDVGDVLDTFTYRLGIVNTQYDMATAVGMMTQLVSASLVGISYYIAYKYADYRIF